MRTTRLLLPAVMAGLLALTACSDDGDDAADDVATLDDGEGDTTDNDSGDGDTESAGGGLGGGTVDPEFQDAMLEFAECMREQGIDFPDPQFNEEEGTVIIGPGPADGGPPSDAEIADMEAANEVCEPILEEVRGEMPEIDPEQQQEMQDEALEFAECMREHGIDFPDPQFDEEGGRVQMEFNEGEGGGSGIDPTDEDFQAAAEECGGEGGFGGSFGVDSEGGEDE